MEYHLFICRHGDAQMPAFRQHDYDRKLTDTGKLEAENAGKWLNSSAGKPALIVSSSARRALSTAYTIASQIAYNQDYIKFHPEIYNASSDTILLTLSKTDSRYKSILLVGHNPGISELITLLSGAYRGNVPTGSVHHLWFDIADWPELLFASAQGYLTNAAYS